MKNNLCCDGFRRDLSDANPWFTCVGIEKTLTNGLKIEICDRDGLIRRTTGGTRLIPCRSMFPWPYIDHYLKTRVTSRLTCFLQLKNFGLYPKMLLLLIFLSILNTVTPSPPENRLLRDLMHGYLPEERPVIDANQSVVVTVGVVLQQIVDLNEREEQIVVNLWLRYTWKDENLRWDPLQYENVTDLRHPVGAIWAPNILLYNSVDTPFDSTYKTNLIGDSNGDITWVPPGIFKVGCKLDITWFPFDEQICFFKFGSWTFSGHQIDLQKGDFDFSEYLENGEWAVVRNWVNRSEKFYACCTEPYPDVQFYIHLRRRTLYYAFNLIMPCGMTMILVMLGFTLNPQSCEKVGLQISVSLAICIFLTIVSEMTPKTSEAVPLLGIFFQSCFIVSVGATTFTVYVQSVHFRDFENSRRMGFWMRYILLEWIPFILCIEKPKRPNTLKTLMKSFENRHEEQKKDIRTAFTYENGTCSIVNALNDVFRDNYENMIIQLQNSTKDDKTDTAMVERLRLLDNIYKHVKMIRESSEDSVENNHIQYEWQFAAAVVDRLGLMLFTIILTATTVVLTMKAPYLAA
uniref:Neuronal acetylcholine receptor subunit alpha-7 n=1 Tax=Panagrellus redivivus TaxID=6233 RepID=A0A7E4VNT3_PANRE